jgi:NAD(P) transhydrogenase subunit beta
MINMVLAAISLQDPDFIQTAYIVAFVCFIVGLQQLSHPTTSRRGNFIAAGGMAIAVGATLLDQQVDDFLLIALGIIIGTAISIPAARMVKMTAMPQMVALFNGLGGGAVALIAWSEFRETGGELALQSEIPALFAAIVGSVSFWGSNIAFAKLQGIISGRPILLPAQHLINGLLLVAALVFAVVLSAGSDLEVLFIAMLVAAALLGAMAVLPIGGADMPVVIAMLNALTGLSAATVGMALDNTALIVGGALVGASGSILTRLMARAMNRSLANILFAGFGTVSEVSTATGERAQRPVRSTTAQDVAIQLAYARRVIIVPGYGMAVAGAQHAVRELTDELQERGVDVKFAIHPVAGRMPGHMNVLLAEANVPYDLLKEMDAVNPEFAQTDVALVIGANDVTNPAARTQPDSPIYGMPILEVDHANGVVVLKRSLAPGFAGIDNELYYDPKTSLLFGDAKASVGEILTEVQSI